MPTPAPGLVLLTPDEVRPSPDNPRRTLDGIEDLAASIAQVGLLQPITVQRTDDGHYEIVTGHRRFAAMKLLCKREIPAIVRKPAAAVDLHAARIIENDQRAGLDPIEEAESLQRFIKAGATQGQVAAKIGRSIAYVGSRLALLELGLAEQEKVRAGFWSINYAYGLVRDARAAQRHATDAPAVGGRPKGAETKAHFGDDHPLADAARMRCTGLKHSSAPKLGNAANGRGGIACGPCWEATIREDERENPTEDLTESGATA
jgi:ParB family chromosome partitioning protein